MSADNWRVCPECKKRNAIAIKDADDERVAAYGKVSIPEYEAMVERVAALAGVALTESLREDYELGLYKDGFHVAYSCNCEACGFHWVYTADVPMNEVMTGGSQ